jgi:osmotically-inducible protein OsmY
MPLAAAEGQEQEAPYTPAAGAADASLRSRVLAELDRDEAARPLGLIAEVRDGVVTLRGTAPHLAARESALMAAAQVGGLLDIRSEIRIPPYPGGDAALREALGRVLAEELRSPLVQVEVHDGAATLRGRVHDTPTRARIRNRAQRFEGVRALDNQVTVPDEERLDDLGLRKRLVELIENRRLYPLEGDIRVEVRDRRVTLSGEVPRVFDRLVAGRIIDIVSSLRGLSNDIRVVPVQGREIRAIAPSPIP